jgi:hypothetical protein
MKQIKSLASIGTVIQDSHYYLVVKKLNKGENTAI